MSSARARAGNGILRSVDDLIDFFSLFTHIYQAHVQYMHLHIQII